MAVALLHVYQLDALAGHPTPTDTAAARMHPALRPAARSPSAPHQLLACAAAPAAPIAQPLRSVRRSAGTTTTLPGALARAPAATRCHIQPRSRRRPATRTTVPPPPPPAAAPPAHEWQQHSLLTSSRDGSRHHRLHESALLSEGLAQPTTPSGSRAVGQGCSRRRRAVNHSPAGEAGAVVASDSPSSAAASSGGDTPAQTMTCMLDVNALPTPCGRAAAPRGGGGASRMAEQQPTDGRGADVAAGSRMRSPPRAHPPAASTAAVSAPVKGMRSAGNGIGSGGGGGASSEAGGVADCQLGSHTAGHRGWQPSAGNGRQQGWAQHRHTHTGARTAGRWPSG